MADVFISYARADKARVAPLVKAIEAKGWSVWWDPEISPGQEFDDEIDAELMSAKAVLVVWTPTSVTSRWVRGEARDAADRNVLVPVRFESARLPIDVRAIHTTDLDGWREDPASPLVQECLHALDAMIARAPHPADETGSGARAPAEKAGPRYTICVLPFDNMSGDSEQEYFSDGITEDIITDLSKVSALGIVSRNGAFMYKGKHVDIPKVARELKVSHVLEGSVRKAGGRVRISAQLIDGTSNQHVWAERYDRDASDIFAIQDEISQAIVKALKLRLLPKEKKAIERRGTESVEAYDLYLMARNIYVTNQEADERSGRFIVRMCTRATEIDPNYAQAWVFMAVGYLHLHELDGRSNDGMEAVEKALCLDPSLAAGHAVRAYILLARGDITGAAAAIATAMQLDPESYEANRAAARLAYQMKRYGEAIRHFEKAAALMEADVNSPAMLISCYTALNDVDGTRRAAELTLKRTEAILGRDQNNAGVIARSATALAAMGDGERAKERMGRALLMEPDNFNIRYNFVCMLSVRLKDKEAALDMLTGVFERVTIAFLPYLKADPDFESLRDDPRYIAMVAAAEARLAAEPKTAASADTPTKAGGDVHG